MTKVRVYWNLHLHMWSVQEYIPKKGWRVWYHADEVMLENVEWKVSRAGRDRVRREKRKNVHAYAVGDLAEVKKVFEIVPRGWWPICYNPYHNDGFVSDGCPIVASDFAHFRMDGKVRGR